jgi:hypothetical protein
MFLLTIMLLYNLHHYRVLSKCVVGGQLARETSSDVSPSNAKCERLFEQFCEDTNVDHVRLLLHTEVR